jgi:hypothetical protein
MLVFWIVGQAIAIASHGVVIPVISLSRKEIPSLVGFRKNPRKVEEGSSPRVGP